MAIQLLKIPGVISVTVLPVKLEENAGSLPVISFLPENICFPAGPRDRCDDEEAEYLTLGVP